MVLGLGLGPSACTPLGTAAPSAPPNLVVGPAAAAEGPSLLVASMVRSLPDPADWREPHGDAIQLVFSEAVEAAGLDPSDFLVVRGDGSRAWPARALLGPAAEFGEHRSVTLEGDFGDGDARAVEVVGALHGVSGASLEGLGADLEGLHQRARIVAYERTPVTDSTCAGRATALRTYWSRPVETPPPTLQVELDAGGTATPVVLDDLDGDNVIDLCFDASLAGPPVRVVAGDSDGAGT